MSKPVAGVPSWATDTNISSGSETGTPTKVQPSSPFLAQGWVPGLTFVGPYFNWLFNLVCGWIAYLNGLPTDADFIGAAFTWTGVHTFNNGAVLASSKAVTYASQPTRTTALNLLSTVDGTGTHPVVVSADGQPVVPNAGATFLVPFSVPVGATITGVTATVSVGGGGVDMTLRLRARGKSGTGASAVSVGTTDTRTGVASQQVLAVSGLSEVGLVSTWYWLEVISTDGSGAGALVTAIVTWTDPGPLSQVV